MTYRTDLLPSIIIFTVLSISTKVPAAEVVEAQDESFFLFIADMSADEKSLDPLAMLAFEEQSRNDDATDEEAAVNSKQKLPTDATNKIEPSLIGEEQP
ncbi:MAG: hypothetical protein Q9M92_08620 [Enterobacterales bacterium]|nr:hypothetical protein [Enterobacterales bacterium]